MRLLWLGVNYMSPERIEIVGLRFELVGLIVVLLSGIWQATIIRVVGSPIDSMEWLSAL